MISLLAILIASNLIKEKNTELIKRSFNREGSLYLALPDEFLLLWYSVLFTIESLSLLYLLVIS